MYAAVSSRRGGVESAAAELLISRLGVLRRGGLTAHHALMLHAKARVAQTLPFMSAPVGRVI
jgi:hypothetical protein